MWQLPAALTSMPQTLGDAQDLLLPSQQVGPDPQIGDIVISCHGPATLEVQMDPTVSGSVYFVPWKRTATADSNYSGSQPFVFRAGTPVFSAFGPVREVRRTNTEIEVRVPVPRIGVREVRQPAPEVFDSRKAPAYMWLTFRQTYSATACDDEGREFRKTTAFAWLQVCQADTVVWNYTKWFGMIGEHHPSRCEH